LIRLVSYFASELVSKLLVLLLYVLLLL